VPNNPTNRLQTNPKVLEALTSSKVLNKDVRLEDIVRASEQISGLLNEADLAAWTFISPNYIYSGDAVEDVTKGRVTIDPKTTR